MKPILEVHNLSKEFNIGGKPESYLALRDIISNPFSKLKEPKKEKFKALNEISFSVMPGDSVGIIGRNGAGKSTLLKILSKITPPSSGKIICRGRIASLLEVGTGFHPELSGRENIFMNGSILGMRKLEIAKHFDAIVDFSGVEKFLDTPLKRYSSGMQLRLAFAVAAHLEPEILIIDEVLAVGDAEFQKKCLGKMDEVSRSGRTVLFVSHQMGTIAQLCKNVIVLKNGTINFKGSTNKAIDHYLQMSQGNDSLYECKTEKRNFLQKSYFTDIANQIKDTFTTAQDLYFNLKIIINDHNPLMKLSCTIQGRNGDYLSTFVKSVDELTNGKKSVTVQVTYPGHLLTPNFYAMRIALFIPNGQVYDLVEMVNQFRIIDDGTSMSIFEDINYGYFFTGENLKIIE